MSLHLQERQPIKLFWLGLGWCWRLWWWWRVEKSPEARPHSIISDAVFVGPRIGPWIRSRLWWWLGCRGQQHDRRTRQDQFFCKLCTHNAPSTSIERNGYRWQPWAVNTANELDHTCSTGRNVLNPAARSAASFQRTGHQGYSYSARRCQTVSASPSRRQSLHR
jgi:hypothetical protein